ncbi:MAG TPA: TonB C-terminal domain-containing protein [Methylosinus sp.]|jgi:outer membrane biosynthesis protein TonB
MKKLVFVVAALMIGGPALAVEGDMATTAPAMTDHGMADPAKAAKPAKKKPKVNASMDEDKAKDKVKTDKKTSEQKPALSKKAYVKLLAAELKRHTPKTADNQIGSVHVAFTVGASGRIVSHKVQSSSNPALEPVVGQILASVHTPPPPGGAFSAVQEFNFH